MRRDFSNKNLEEIPSKWFDRFMRKVLGAKDVIFFAQKEQNIQARDVLRLFYESLRKFPLSIIAVISATIFSSILLIIIPLYYKNFFDVLSSGGDATGNAILLRNTILVIFVLNITIFVTRRITCFGNNYLASSMTASLRSRAFAY